MHFFGTPGWNVSCQWKSPGFCPEKTLRLALPNHLDSGLVFANTFE